ncbi:MAG: DUF559 domain-containing protein [Pseudomonadota bacterium]
MSTSRAIDSVQRTVPSSFASAQILDLTLSEAEADTWMYLGCLLALGSAEPLECWEETRRWIEFSGGDEALDALDVIHDIQTRPEPVDDLCSDQTRQVVDPPEAALVERLRAAAEMWVAKSRPARIFDVLSYLANAERVQSELRGRLFYHWSQDTEHREELIRRHAKSPIEETLGLELVRRGCMVLPPANVGTVRDFDADRRIPAVLTMQSVFGKYRADYLVTAPGRASGFVLECDGHEFHEKTKVQAARDKQRDRWFLSRGWPTMRFTGSEIHQYTQRCADEVIGQASALLA